MSIVTKTGDHGSTGLMYNRRVSKCDPQVEAYGTLDELKANIGMGRALAQKQWLRDHLLKLAKGLVPLMGELATHPDNLERYSNDGFELITPGSTAPLDLLANELERQNPPFDAWATPGANRVAASLDVARTVCRRAERQVCRLHEARQQNNNEILVFLNRLSDVLWLLARWAEVNEAQGD